MELNKIITGDCLTALKMLPDNSVDACVTDPPYGIRFMGHKWDYEIPSVEVWQEVLRVLKPGAHVLVACGTRSQHRMAVNIEDAGFQIRDVIVWHYGSGFPKNVDISKAIDKAAGMQREVLSEGRETKRLIPGADQVKTGSYIKDNGRTFTSRSTAPATAAAKKWAGWGTALKPASEFWTLARKPIRGTIVSNVLEHGTGGLNIDESRIPFESEEDFQSATYGTGANILGGNYAGGKATLDSDRKNIEADRRGRWPANLILDEFMAGEMDKQSGELTSGKLSCVRAPKADPTVYGKYVAGDHVTGYGDTGGASRFFYVAKASQEERGAYNRHPTVKPLALMQYLVKLICPIEAGRVVLDPYAGSGTTLLAAGMLGVNWMGMEQDPKWVETAERRLREKLGLFNRVGQALAGKTPGL